MTLIIGTAGWSIPRGDADAFPSEGSSLARYAARFGGVEINSSFHRPHRPSTWARWGSEVPRDFRFAVKLPKTITHERKLVGCGDLLERFLGEASGLGGKLAILLLQLPPKLGFDERLADDFFRGLAAATPVQLVCEPRHPSWFGEDAESLLRDRRVARVAADPALSEVAARPGGWRGLDYWRLHGSPAMYRSAYGPERIAAYADLIRQETAQGGPAWCMFDNTAASAATADALALQTALEAVRR